MNPWLLGALGILMAVAAIYVPDAVGPTPEECRKMGPKECAYVWGDR